LDKGKLYLSKNGKGLKDVNNRAESHNSQGGESRRNRQGERFEGGEKVNDGPDKKKKNGGHRMCKKCRGLKGWGGLFLRGTRKVKSWIVHRGQLIPSQPEGKTTKKCPLHKRGFSGGEEVGEVSVEGEKDLHYEGGRRKAFHSRAREGVVGVVGRKGRLKGREAGGVVAASS